MAIAPSMARAQSPTYTGAVSRLGRRRSFLLAIVGAQCLLALIAGPASALDSCGGCGTRTATWVGPLIIVVAVAFVAVMVVLARRQLRSEREAQGADLSGPRDHD
jgi:hypothetical protein